MLSSHRLKNSFLGLTAVKPRTNSMARSALFSCFILSLAPLFGCSLSVRVPMEVSLVSDPDEDAINLDMARRDSAPEILMTACWAFSIGFLSVWNIDTIKGFSFPSPCYKSPFGLCMAKVICSNRYGEKSYRIIQYALSSYCDLSFKDNGKWFFSYGNKCFKLNSFNTIMFIINIIFTGLDY